VPLGEGTPDLPDEMCTPVYLTHGPPQYDSMRERVVPMISDALKRTPMLGLDITAWDFVVVPMSNTIVVGVAIAVRGIALTGPGRELAQFRPFGSWRPEQAEVDLTVAGILMGLRETRAQQMNGQP